MRSQLQFVITAALLCHLILETPPVTSQAPRSDPGTKQGAVQQGNCHVVLTAPPASSTPGQKPGAASHRARMILISPEEPVDIVAAQCEEEKTGGTYVLRGDVKIKFADYVFQGDFVTYDPATGDATAAGRTVLDGGPRDMHVRATHGTYNVRTQTGKFHNVSGTTGARFRGTNVTLTSSNPLAFGAKVMEQTGPQEYVLYHGWVTSCELPRPKWRFHAAKIILRVGDSAKIYTSTFRLKGVPVLYLPYASTPAEKLGRQSGFLVPTFGTSNTKGTIVGESYYWAINRSMDATAGAQYMSKIGWMLLGDYRARPTESSFLNLNYFQVLTSTTTLTGTPPTTPVNQGGQDVKLNGAAVFAHDVRGVASLEYLSSFLFREQFSPTFTQAVNSEVSSNLFASKSVQGYSFNGYLARYQNFQSTTPDNVITILHIPGIELDGVDHKIFGSPIYWSYDLATEGLKRSEPGFVTPNLVGRFDVMPTFSLPLFFRGWTIRPAVDLRNTTYTQQDIPGPTGPEPVLNILNRRTLTAAVEFRLPTLEKVFDHPHAGRRIKHTIEPYTVYRYTNGVENFASIIRFDFRDILSNTNEVEYGLVQRVYLKRLRSGCDDEEDKDKKSQRPSGSLSHDCTPAGANEFLTWELKQKYFIDPDFGGAVVNGTRNVFTTTDALTGIAFVTQPRRFSPIVSRLNFRTSGGSDVGRDVDVGWALDYDTTLSRINSSTLYATYHIGNYFVGGSEAYMQDVGEIVVPVGQTTPLPPCAPGGLNSTPCVPQVYNQVRALVGYGSPGKRGWSAAANVGYDFEFQTLQYGAAQTAYNWDCCGIAVEYRRFSLGSIRNENQYRFAFTLANIGTFGNMKRQERLF